MFFLKHVFKTKNHFNKAKGYSSEHEKIFSFKNGFLCENLRYDPFKKDTTYPFFGKKKKTSEEGIRTPL